MMVKKKTESDVLVERKEISAGIIIFRRTTEGIKFLILYHGGDYWNFPKGKLEESERSWQAAFREVTEETGLKKNELKLMKDFKTFEKFRFRRGKDKIFKVVILYLAQTTRKQIILSDEHDGYGWFKFTDAKRIMAKHGDSVKIIQRVYKYLKNQQRSRKK